MKYISGAVTGAGIGVIGLLGYITYNQALQGLRQWREQHLASKDYAAHPDWVHDRADCFWAGDVEAHADGSADCVGIGPLRGVFHSLMGGASSSSPWRRWCIASKPSGLM